MQQFDDFNFEIAFSLLDQDKEIAEEMKLKLGNGERIFLYTTNAKTLKFKDAILELDEIYRIQSRLVIILHRSTYGLDSWTSIEREAILSRRLDIQRFGTSHSFFVINMDNSAVNYIGRNYIHEKYNPSKLDSLIEIINFKIIELYGNPLHQSTIEKAKLLTQKKKWKDELENKYLRNEQSTIDVKNELGNLLRIIEEKFHEAWPISTSQFSKSFNKPSLENLEHHGFGISINHVCLRIKYFQPYPNVILNSKLVTDVLISQDFHYPKQCENGVIYYFAKSMAGDFMWSESLNYDKLLSSESLAEILFARFFNHVEKKYS